MSATIGATARVRLTVEVPVTSRWGSDCPLEQIFKQASDEATRYIKNLFERHRPDGGNRVQIVGQPDVVAVLLPEARDK